MVINTNMNALSAYRNMSKSVSMAGKSTEKLSSGFKINKASDDAAGLSISEKMRAQIKGLDKAANNAQNAVSLLQTAEGALNETQSMLHRARELAIQASTSTNTAEDNAVLDKEFQMIMEEIDRAASTTQFNQKNLVDGSFGSTATAGATLIEGNGISGFELTAARPGEISFKTEEGTDGAGTVKITATWTDDEGRTVTESMDNIAIPDADSTGTVNFEKVGVKLTVNEKLTDSSLAAPDTDTLTVTAGKASIQVGANANQTIEFQIRDMSATGGVLKLGGENIATVDGAQQAIKALDNALTEVSMERANIGAISNRLEYTVNNLNTSSENLTAAESRIRDVDMAKEMLNYSKANILQQASQSMLAQANQQPQGILQLLR